MIKKRIFKFSLSLILTFIFVCNVNAGVEVCGNGTNHHVIETSLADPAEFNTWAPVCNWKFQDYKPVADGNGNKEFKGVNSQTYAENLAQELIHVVQTLYDDAQKSSQTVNTTVKRCDLPDRYYLSSYNCLHPVNTYPVCKNSKGKIVDCNSDDADFYKEECPGVWKDGKCMGSTPVKDIKVKWDETDKGPAAAAEKAGDGYEAKYCTLTSSVLYCPVYTCERDTRLIGACTPSFKVDGEPAYCVNPSNPFTNERGSDGFTKHEATFQEDPDFDVNECLSSYSTIDCGYANILMESKWNNDNGKEIRTKSTELAMRLWGAHSTTAGYQFTFGLSLRYGNTADNQDGCNERTLYLYEGQDQNVYYVTQNYIMQNFLTYVSSKYKDNDYIDPIAFRKDDEFGKHFIIDCDKIGRKVGLVCGSGSKSKSYRTAFGLFFNTVQGNSEFRSHMKEVFGITVNAPKGVDVTELENNEVGIVVDYGEYRLTGIHKDVQYDCDTLDSNTSISAEEREAIRPYCQTKILFTDLNGNPTETRPDYCVGKNSLWCTSKPVNLAVCSDSEYSKTITIKYPDDSNSRPVRLINCGSVDNQILYSIIDEDEGPESNGTPGDTKEIPFTLKIYSCKGNCDSNTIRTNSASCNYDANKADNEVSTGYVKDPSLKCILNSNNDLSESMYDYSEEFGVNTNFCRVYCSDEVEYYIPDKLTIKSGLAFKYDIGIKSYLNKTNNLPISNVVKSKRTCVSKINYNKKFTTATNFERLYGLNPQTDIFDVLGEGKYIENWKDLFKVLKAKASKERSRTENINELLYDLYNCNFYAQSKFDQNNVTKPKQKVFEINTDIDNVYSYIQKEYGESRSYGFDSCTLNSNTNDCITMNRIDYAGGSETNLSNNVGTEQVPIRTSSVTSSTLSNVTYCSGDNCFKYPDSTEANSVEDLATYNYSNIQSSSSETDGNVGSYNFKIPTNDYAMFSISTEVGFYNTSRFQSIPSTGYVKAGNSDSSLMSLDPYTYPTSKNAYTMCRYNANSSANIFSGRIGSNSRDLGPTTNSSCKVTHIYNDMHTYKYRHDNDKFQNMLLNSEFMNPKCYIDVEFSQVQCNPGDKTCKNSIYDITEYRNVNRKNIFPNASISINNTNWNTSEGIIIKEQIESSGEFIYTDDNNKQYSFTITPEQIKAIRRNNNNINSYVEIGLKDCQQKDGMYVNCRSYFLDEIRNGNNDTSQEYATINGGHDGNNLFNNN